MRNVTKSALAVAACLSAPAIASAHISVAGPAFANATFEASFSVGHGCEDPANPTGPMLDTMSVTIDIPAGVTSVRAVDSTLGRAVSQLSSGAITSITWSKNQSDLLSADIDFYRLPVRMKLPNTPFSTVYFHAHQICLDASSNPVHVEWVGEGQTTALPDGAPPPEPAPSLVLLPARTPGWNKYTVPVDFTNLAVFNDAEIVWSGNAAYSVNPNYKALIGVEPNSSLLTTISAGSEIWVKY
ncbi:MAG TPA: DUF1775 domain-containing protein [Polyangiaceae bacterium]|nr:DUF1775 domain-containing protein [Polyangiaceae bacterium]